MKKLFLSYLFTPIAFTLAWLTLICTVLIFFPEQKFIITQEGEIIEIFTNIGYILMLASMMYLAQDYTDKITSWGVYLFLGIVPFYVRPAFNTTCLKPILLLLNRAFS